jgi:ATP-dependent DNA helicase DinG
VRLAELDVAARRIQELRPAQAQALAWIAEREERFLLISAPTGSGKSLIGRAAGAIVQRRAVYLASDLALQAQFVDEFPDARELKGRANYRPDGAGLLTCDDCDYGDGECSVCGTCEREHEEGGHDRGRCLRCPYALAKRDALRAPFAALNTAYFLTEANNAGDFSRRGQLVVVDEADLLEGVLLERVGVRLPPHRLLRLGLTRTPSAGLEAWADEALAEAEAIAQDQQREGRAAGDAGEAAGHRREAEYWRNLAQRLQVMRAELEEDPASWVQVGADRDSVEVKPVFVRGHARRLLWSHGGRFLLTSATLLAPEVLAAELGIPDGEWAAIQLPSSFPPENRPVRYTPVASMASRHRRQNLAALVGALDRLLDRHQGRVLVHSQTFELARGVQGLSRHGSRMLLYGSGGRDQALETFRANPGRVLVGPSLKRGVDLPDDLCEAIVILVVPRPDWGDERVRARVAAPGGAAWYDAESVRQLCQMTGRGVRHEADRCETYLLDSEFGRLLSRRRGMFPRWWLEALQIEGATAAVRASTPASRH